MNVHTLMSYYWQIKIIYEGLSEETRLNDSLRHNEAENQFNLITTLGYNFDVLCKSIPPPPPLPQHFNNITAEYNLMMINLNYSALPIYPCLFSPNKSLMKDSHTSA